MSRFVVEFDVTTSPQNAFEFIAVGYFQNHASWDPGVIATEPIDGSHVRSGLRGSETRRFMGTRTTSFVITELQAPRLFELRDQPHTWHLTRTYQIEPQGEGARITFVFDMSPRARWFRALHPIVRPMINRQVRTNMKRLDQLLSQLP